MVDLSRTIPDILIQAARQWGDTIALEDEEHTLSFSDLEQRARQVAKAFIAHDFEVGQTFSIWAPNIHEWIWTAIGGQMAGGILVPLNTRYKGIEASDILNRSRAKLLFTVTGFLETDYPALLSEQQLHGLQKTILLRGNNDQNEAIDDFLSSADSISDEQLEQRLAQLNGDGTSDIMYTSGTTGLPKGVISNHGQVTAITQAWSNAVGLNNEDRYLIVNPFFHSFGYKSGWLACLMTGATILPEPVFNTHKILKRIESDKISMLPGAPTIFQSLLIDSELKQTDLSSLRCAVTGAASVPVQMVKDMKTVLGFKDVYTGYGLTECVVVSICKDGDDFETIANTAGRPLDGIEVKLVDEQEQPVAAGELGMIKVRGFNVMQGYFEDAEATAKTIDKNGWLDTGDIGWQNEAGYIKVTDRSKDMFICGGFNCYPAEIENLLLRHDDIIDAAVKGVADERMGEVGHAWLVSKPGTKLDPATLGDWAREQMANFKVPREFHVIDELPRNASGKVMKFKL